MMKNIFLIGAAAILLSGCTGQENPEETAVKDATEEKSADGEVRGMTADSKSKTEQIPGEYKIHAQEVGHAQTASDPSEFEELDHAKKHFIPEDYEIRVANDNPGNRVLLFMDGDKPAYKTVLIKNQGLLKIISNDKGLIEETKI
ncbi:hypothetical protein [Bhargavaea beijingensis]|uniref:hypothetical protein n=1 Tax=Bhargavaea beijingensis TaxID=426756 RepID=UPI002223EEC2|nr:hypothetical protein [Bhargavaea beijingensis]MCW1928830.1 hypothetical protein [Bhargavaea beijingensis]